MRRPRGFFAGYLTGVGVLAAALVVFINVLPPASHAVPAKPSPYHVTIQVGQNGKAYHTTCRKLHHVAPVYVFSSCRPVRVFP